MPGDHLELLFSVGACSKRVFVIACDPPELDMGGAAMQVLVCRVQTLNSSQAECPVWEQRGSLLPTAMDGWKNEGAEDMDGGKCQAEIFV